jgi:hypothetical protein
MRAVPLPNYPIENKEDAHEEKVTFGLLGHAGVTPCPRRVPQRLILFFGGKGSFGGNEST